MLKTEGGRIDARKVVHDKARLARRIKNFYMKRLLAVPLLPDLRALQFHEFYFQFLEPLLCRCYFLFDGAYVPFLG